MSNETETLTLDPAPLEGQDFSPFGEVISLEATPRLPIDLYSGRNAVHGPVVLESDETPEFILFRVGYRGGDIRYLERHTGMTQTFIPLGGDPYVCVVAAPGAPLRDGFPEPGALRAFLVPGDVCLNLRRGTWHEPPFPTRDGQMFLISSQPGVTRGLQASPDPNGEVHLMDVDKRNPVHRTGRALRVSMP
ncbi:ureidoglycolate lyase [Nocardiopsis flavescens]|uniref:Ureidoglycolate hydrolase (Allantoin degradation) n=1 Tax=Nocardiopsis flavescens TaxID=758803 RepID=A0A1M6CQR0_9ACTN|nr:ureidoglycolate lyase [Nocardiopsis flavescens]SHI63435.1 Ureidoglycolate hydrolase (allantoin degradation) [Nocardiopsis flavescens]